MRALRLENNALVLDQSYPLPKERANHTRVQILHAALNRRDDWILQGKYPNIQPSILGSDGCGVVRSKDSADTDQEVILCPSLHWGENSAFQSPSYTILGMPSDGTFADHCLIPNSLIYPKPKHLSSAQAAALPLAGLTAWRALMTRGQLQKGERVLITGIGGGVSLFAFQLALAAEAEVWVTSSSDLKIDQAIQQGARGGVNYTKEKWNRKLPSFNVIIDGAGGDGFGSLIRNLDMGGRLVFYGGTQGFWPKILPQHLFFKQSSILGSTMGSPQEFSLLCQFITKHKIIPIVDSVFPIDKYQAAFGRLNDPNKMGKVILSFC